MRFFLRDAREQDLDAINAIYNHFVTNSTCTYQVQLNSPHERRAWFHDHVATDDACKKFPVIVAESLDTPGKIMAWGSLGPFHRREGYMYTVENSVYVDPDHHRQGLGRALLAQLISRAAAAGHRTIVAVISADQAPSIALHASLGFVETGRLRNAGYKFNRWLDVAYMQLDLSTPQSPPPSN